MSQLCSDSSHASSLPHCKLPGFDTQAVKNRIYIHTPRKEEGQTDPGLAVWLYVWKWLKLLNLLLVFFFMLHVLVCGASTGCGGKSQR